jgi:hypothetical protein
MRAAYIDLYTQTQQFKNLVKITCLLEATANFVQNITVYMSVL